MKNFDIKASDLAFELAIRTARGWDAAPSDLRAEYGFSRATAYRWAKRLREVRDKLRTAPRASPPRHSLARRPGPPPRTPGGVV
jgi:hypothetical protein